MYKIANNIELEITTSCNLKCFNCDRQCRQASSKEFITLEQIKKFINETLSIGHRWNIKRGRNFLIKNFLKN